MAQAAADSSKRVLLKAVEVCERAGVQQYVLRTWEMEFPDLGVAKTPGGPRLYRPADVERVLRIRQLVFVDGLTLAGARRKLDEERQPSDELPFEEADGESAKLNADMLARITTVRNELRALLTMLSAPRLRSTTETPSGTVTPTVAADTAPAPAGAARKTTKRRKAAS